MSPRRVLTPPLFIIPCELVASILYALPYDDIPTAVSALWMSCQWLNGYLRDRSLWQQLGAMISPSRPLYHEAYEWRLRGVLLGRRRWHAEFEQLTGESVLSLASASWGDKGFLHHMRAMRVSLKILTELFRQAFENVRDRALVSPIGLERFATHEVVALRLLAGSRMWSDIEEATRVRKPLTRRCSGSRTLRRLCVLGEDFVKSSFDMIFDDGRRDVKHYADDASAFQWIARTVHSILVNPHTRLRITAAVRSADELLIAYATRHCLEDQTFEYPISYELAVLLYSREFLCKLRAVLGAQAIAKLEAGRGFSAMELRAVPMKLSNSCTNS